MNHQPNNHPLKDFCYFRAFSDKSYKLVDRCLFGNKLPAVCNALVRSSYPPALGQIYLSFGLTLIDYRRKEDVWAEHILVYELVSVFIFGEVEEHRTHDGLACLGCLFGALEDIGLEALS